VRSAGGRAAHAAGPRRWADDVRAGRYPRDEHTYAIAPETLAEVTRRLGRE
jgi:ketopantoate hydroxymethyltransferase